MSSMDEVHAILAAAKSGCQTAHDKHGQLLQIGATVTFWAPNGSPESFVPYTGTIALISGGEVKIFVGSDKVEGVVHSNYFHRRPNEIEVKG